MYELILRVKEGIPFPTLMVIELLIESALARAQRDGKVIICDYLWMGNHVHMIFVSLCAEACECFYQELQKKITESIKRLLGVHRLNLWEGDAVLAEILDVEAAINTKAYIYANPARANLVETVSEYPGLSTWEAFERCISEDTKACVSKEVPWVRFPSIKKAPSRSLSEKQDHFLHREISSKAKKRHVLQVFPNAWMNVFKVKEKSEIALINRRIKDRIKESEEDARIVRLKDGKKLIGKEQLTRQAILHPHTPKKRDRRVFVISSSKELRLSYISMHNEICAECARCYIQWKLCDFSVKWPPGTFPPSPGVRASAIVLQ